MTRICLLLVLIASPLLRAQTTAPASPASAAYNAVELIPFDTEKDLNVSREFQVALYEYLVEETKNSHGFDHVYRAGELKSPTPSAIRVAGTIMTFHKGSQRLRQVTTVAGWTSIKVHVRLEDQTTGKLLAEKDMTGRVRFFGGNLRATLSLAKQVSKLLKQNVHPAAAAGKA